MDALVPGHRPLQELGEATVSLRRVGTFQGKHYMKSSSYGIYTWVHICIAGLSQDIWNSGSHGFTEASRYHGRIINWPQFCAGAQASHGVTEASR